MTAPKRIHNRIASSMLTMWLTPADHQFIRDRAAFHGVSVSRFLRDLGFEAPYPPGVDAPPDRVESVYGGAPPLAGGGPNATRGNALAYTRPAVVVHPADCGCQHA